MLNTSRVPQVERGTFTCLSPSPQVEGSLGPRGLKLNLDNRDPVSPPNHIFITTVNRLLFMLQGWSPGPPALSRTPDSL